MRGIAAAVVGSLPLLSVPLMAGSAQAYNLNADLSSRTQFSGKMSTADDGSNTSIHLLATGLVSGATNIASVDFRLRYLDSQIVLAPTTKTVTIANVQASLSAPGVYSFEWSPSQAQLDILSGTFNSDFEIVVQARDGANALLGGEIPRAVTFSATGKVSNIFEGPARSVGVNTAGFLTNGTNADLAVVSGTTTSGVLTLDSPDNPAAAMDAVVSGAGAIKSFAGLVDLTGISFSGGDNQIVVTALGKTANTSQVLVNDSDDAEVIPVYTQTLTQATGAAATPNVAPGGTTDITITVLDQNGRPMVGSRVTAESGPNGPINQAPRYTDVLGKATFAGATVGTWNFYVDSTRVAGKQASDKSVSVAVTSFDAETNALVLSSADGSAFDFDEYVDGDIKVKATNAAGDPRVGTVVSYVWKLLPFTAAAGTAPTQVAAGQSGQTAANTGEASIPFPANQAEGTYTLEAFLDKNANGVNDSGDLASAPLVVKAGEAEVAFTDGVTAQRQAGKDGTFAGTLQLDDATALAGRTITLAWAAAAGGNTTFADQAKQPAGTTRTGATTATAVTSAAGAFSIVVSDPAAAPDVDELNGKITGTFGDTSKQLDVDFMKDLTLASLDVSAADLHGAPQAGPGRPVEYTLTAKNAAGQVLDGVAVGVTTDHGFFTPNFANGDFTPAVSPTVGAQVGNWLSKGATTTLTTGDTGTATLTLAIARDAGFDDDGKVAALVRAKVGAVTKDIVVNFDSKTPLNVGAVTLAYDNVQNSTVLPKARTGQSVNFDVIVTDQFGNRVAVNNLTVADNTTKSDVVFDTPGNTAPADSVFTLDASTLHATSTATAADSQSITVTLPAATRTLWAADGADAGTALDRGTSTADVASNASILNWYVLSGGTSKVALARSTPSVVKVGTNVTETATVVDQYGQVLSGVLVKFTRKGPDAADPDEVVTVVTNSAGKAAYSFIGTEGGKATVFAAATVAGTSTGSTSNGVTFKYRISPKLVAANDASGNDLVGVKAGARAAGAVVKLYRVKSNGRFVLIATKRLNGAGAIMFKVNEPTAEARNAATTYIVRVMATSTTFAARSNLDRIK
jgi:hypothetical protein